MTSEGIFNFQLSLSIGLVIVNEFACLIIQQFDTYRSDCLDVYKEWLKLSFCIEIENKR